MKIEKAIKPENIHIGCLNCSTAQRIASLDTIICVGFGSAYVTCDGYNFYDGEDDFKNDKEPKTIREIETIASSEPEKDWRVVMYGPMHGETYQRQPITADLNCGPLSDNHTSKNKKYAWVMIDSNEGFA